MDTHHLVAYGILLLCCITCKSTHALTTYYMDELCSGFTPTYTILVGSTKGSTSSGVIKATRYSTYKANFKCTIYLEPYTGNSILIAFRKIDFRSTDKLTVTQGTFGTKEDYSSYYSDDTEWKTFYSSVKVSLNMTTSLWYFTGYSGFQLTYTAYRSGHCLSGEYKCDNFNCISDSLMCDGHNHCGDRSDQVYCGSLSVSQIVGVIFGVAFLVIAVVAGTIFARRRRRFVAMSSTIHPPQQQQQQQPYPSGYQYPAQGIYPSVQGNHPPPPPVYMTNPVYETAKK